MRQDRPQGAHCEYELKLLLDGPAARQLLRQPWLKARLAGPARSTHLAATYFDTPEQDLRRQQAALRVRREGRRWVQCLKCRPPEADLHTRSEYESPVPAGRLDLAAIREPLAALAFSDDQAARLQPVFQTDVRRRQVLVQLPGGGTAELAIDTGSLSAGERRAAVAEVELELRTGTPAQLHELALEILDAAPCRLGVLTKADRGYALFAGQPPAYHKATPLLLPPECSVEDAMSRMFAHTLEHLRRNEDCLLSRSHVEGVHQVRVAVRRLRSILHLYRGLLPEGQWHEWTDELRWLAASLGPARDWDVFLHETLTALPAESPRHEDLDCLRSHAETRRRAAYAEAEAALLSPRYTRLILRLGLWLQARAWRVPAAMIPGEGLLAPAPGFARAILHAREQRMRRRGRHFRRLDPPHRHRLRLDIKKLRYAAEFFVSLFPAAEAAGRDYIACLAALQDALGRLNDAAVARDLAHQALAEATRDEAPRLAYASGLLIGWHDCAAQAEPAAPKLWKRLKALPPFWE